jgi:hypothetical protein
MVNKTGIGTDHTCYNRREYRPRNDRGIDSKLSNTVTINVDLIKYTPTALHYRLSDLLNICWRNGYTVCPQSPVGVLKNCGAQTN